MVGRNRKQVILILLCVLLMLGLFQMMENVSVVVLPIMPDTHHSTIDATMAPFHPVSTAMHLQRNKLSTSPTRSPTPSHIDGDQSFESDVRTETTSAYHGIESSPASSSASTTTNDSTAKGTMKANTTSVTINQETHSETRRFVLHVGPPKTATTTLQTELTEFFAANGTKPLDKEITDQSDGFLYVGRYYEPRFHDAKQRWILNRHDLPLLAAAKLMFKPPQCPEILNKTVKHTQLIRCVRPFLDEIQTLDDDYNNGARRNRSPAGPHLLMSDEGFSKWSPSMFQALFEGLMNFASKQDYLWEVELVVSYRRFYQWLASDLYQRFRLDKPKPRKELWPGQHRRGKHMPTLWQFLQLNLDEPRIFTTVTRDHIETAIRGLGLDTDIRKQQHSLSIRVLNLHHPNNRTMMDQLLCDGDWLPRACRQLREIKDGVALSIRNDGQSPTHLNIAKTEVWDFSQYDRLATGAAQLGWINTSHFTRSEVRQALAQFDIAQVHNTSTSTLIQSCPSEKDFQFLLNLSLDMERRALSEETATSIREATMADFETVARNLYCDVAVNATLHQDSWKDFVQASFV